MRAGILSLLTGAAAVVIAVQAAAAHRRPVCGSDCAPLGGGVGCATNAPVLSPAPAAGDATREQIVRRPVLPPAGDAAPPVAVAADAPPRQDRETPRCMLAPPLQFAPALAPLSATRPPAAGDGSSKVIAGTASQPRKVAARSWVDNTGRYRVEAALIEVRDGDVRLADTSGRVLVVPWERLSAADLDFVREELWSSPSWSAPPPAHAEPRLWTDHTGQRSVQARMVNFDRDMITLQIDSGRVYQVPEERLSPADRVFVALCRRGIAASAPRP